MNWLGSYRRVGLVGAITRLKLQHHARTKHISYILVTMNYWWGPIGSSHYTWVTTSSTTNQLINCLSIKNNVKKKKSIKSTNVNWITKKFPLLILSGYMVLHFSSHLKIEWRKVWKNFQSQVRNIRIWLLKFAEFSVCGVENYKPLLTNWKWRARYLVWIEMNSEEGPSGQVVEKQETKNQK